MSLVIATACIDGKFKKLNYARLTIKNHKEYAEARNVSYACLRKRYPHMTEKQSKVTFVLNLLQSNEWVFFTDCDSLFMDFSVDIKHFFRHTNSDMIICGDKNWAMNSGQYFARNASWVRELLFNVTLETRIRDSHGCVGFDNAAFNWFLWGSCTTPRGNFKMIPGEEHKCEEIVKKSLFPSKLSCAMMNAYIEDT